MSEEATADHAGDVIARLVASAIEDSRRNHDALEAIRMDGTAIRAEMKAGFTDVRGDVQETQRLQKETNGRVADHDTAIAAILKRQATEDEAQRIRDAIAAERRRWLRYPRLAWHFVNTPGFVTKVGGLVIVGGWVADKAGWI